MDNLLAMRPKDGSAVAIRDAIANLEEEKRAAEALLATMIARRGDMLVSANRSELAAHEKAITETRDTIERLVAFHGALKEKLPTVEREEQITALQEKLAELDVESKSNAFSTWWKTKYETHARAIAEGLELEAVAHAARLKAQTLVRQLEQLGHEVPALVSPTHLAVGGPLRVQTLGELVSLPGVLGAPAVPSEMVEVTTKRIVQKPVEDQSGSHVIRRGYENPLPMRDVEIEEKNMISRCVRPDTPIWKSARLSPF